MKWWKSHYYTICLRSAVLRENVAQFLSHLGADVSHDLFKKAEVVVDALRTDSIDQDSIKEFIFDLVELRSKFEKFLSRYQDYMKNGYKEDDQFALFTNMLKGFHAYYAMFIAIRTGNWSLRLASLKMMTTRFVQSGVHTYKWLVLWHLANVHGYPDSILKCLELGVWVSTLQDGQGVSLAHDKFHKRTASKDIQLVMSKQLTETNMQILTQ